MDMIVKLPLSSGFDSILVFIDLLSKATHFIPFRKSMSAKELVRVFCRKVIRLHGLPDRVVLNQGPTFTSNYWLQFLRLSQIHPATSTAYHPQTDGQTERMNQILEDHLLHFVSYNQQDWSDKLDLAEFSINNLHSSSSGVSPFFFVHGYHPRFNTLTSAPGKSSVDDLVVTLQKTQDQAVTALHEAQQRQAYQVNKHRRPSPVFQPGNLVLLLRKFIQTWRPNSRLDYHHIGPFKFIFMVGPNAAKLDLASHYPLLHPVFNFSLLMVYKDPGENPFQETAILHQNGIAKPKDINWSMMESVLDYRSKRKGSKKYLICWKFSTPAADCWLSCTEILRSLTILSSIINIAPRHPFLCIWWGIGNAYL
jgi:transposase InsO family protein